MKFRFSDAFLPTGRSKNSTNKSVLMSIGEIFLPKIARSDPEVRKKAVQKENDAELLKKVAKNDSDPEVRRSALKRLQKLISFETH